jgi:translocation and assembly module TamB
MGKFKLRNIIILSVIALTLGLLFIALRGPHVSNLLKKLILPELSVATGRQVMAQKIYINIFPLFIGAKEVRVFEEGNEMLRVPRIKAYIGLSGIIKKEIVLRRLVINSPDIRSDASQIEDIIRKVREYAEMERKSAVTVKVNAVVLNNGKFSLRYKDASFSGSGVSIDAVMDRLYTQQKSVFVMPKINFTIKSVISKIKGWPELKGGIKGSVAIKKDILDVRDLQIGISGSKIDAQGGYPLSSGPDKAKGGSFQMRLSLLSESFKKIFGLKQSGEGQIFAKGNLSLNRDHVLKSVADMELKGEFYIQTLMELLHVKERVEGLVNFTGNIKGPLAEVKGSAKARLQNGNLFSIDLKELSCNISYSEGVFNFKDGKASLYNGHAEAEAMLAVIKSNDYSVHVNFSDVDSPAALDLIGWKPDIPSGKVKGELRTSGNRFNPSGWFDYESRAEGQDILGRVRGIKGSYNLNGDVLSLHDIEARTRKSILTANGDMDLASSSISSIHVRLKTTDVTDVTLPYRRELHGSGEFAGKVTGRFDDPFIEGKVSISEAAYEDYNLGNITGSVAYKKDLLEIRDLSATGTDSASTADIRGTVRFPDAAELFDFKRPVYSLSVSAKGADLGKTVKLVNIKTLKQYPKGRLNADFRVTGPGPMPLYQGTLLMNDVLVDKVMMDSASMAFSYNYKDLLISDAVFRKGSSALTASGRLSHDDKFSFKASGSKIFLKDVSGKAMPADAHVSLQAEGKGSLDDPVIDMDGIFHGGKINGSDMGDGKFKASLRNWTLVFNSSLFDNKVAFNGKAYLKDDMPWTARLDVSSGRYDFLVSAFLKDRPEDLLVSIKGYADMSGNRDHFSASAVINQLNATLFGYSFSNESDISFEMKDKKIFLPMGRMRSGTTSFKVSGNIEIASGYDLVIEGSSSLTPVKGFFRRIETIRGDTEFVFSITGKWDSPKVNGGVTISNAFFGVKDIPHRISSINGYFYIDEDKVVIQKLSGKIGGGDIDITGVAYLRRFKMKSFYVDAVLGDISVNVSKDFPVNFNGNILYKGTPDSQTVSGEIRINRAKYRERVEWKSWLFKAKPKERPKGEVGTFEKAVLNVKVYGSENISVDNNIARTSLKVDMLLRGTVLHPVVLGRIESQTGTVYFRNNEFRILHASADFSDPRRISPVLEIVAETSIKGYKIRMNLEGQTDQFNLSLVSDPPLEEIDIFGLLTVGRLGKEMKGIEGGIGAGEATSFLTGKVQDVLEERVRTLTGLDRLEVDPYVSKTTGLVSPRITVSKRLIGDKLFVTYSSAVGSTENNVLKIEYVLNKNMSLVGLRDEKGSIGSDIKFRFEFK